MGIESTCSAFVVVFWGVIQISWKAEPIDVQLTGLRLFIVFK